MKLEYSEFLETVMECPVDVSSVYNVLKDIVRFFIQKKDQKIFYNIENYNSFDDLNLKYELDRFGLSTESILSVKSAYLLIVDPEKGLTESLEEFKLLTPEDVDPTHMYVMSNDVDIIKKFYDKILEIYPNLTYTQSTVKGLTPEKYMESIADKLKLDTSYLYDVEDLVQRFDRSFSPSADGYVDEFSKIVEEVHKAVSGKKLIVVSSNPDNPSPTYYKLVAELYLMYGDKFYLENNSRTYVLSCIMKCLFNKNYQLTEETFKYFMNLPDILTSYEDCGKAFHLVDGSTKELKFSCSYCEIGSTRKEDCLNGSFNVSDVKLDSIYDYYNIDTVQGCEELKEVIMNLYGILELPRNFIISALNLVFFRIGEKRFIGVIKESRFSVNVKTIVPGIGEAYQTLEYEKLKMCYPLDVFLDGAGIAKILRSENLPLKRISPFKSKRKMACFISTILVTRNSVLNESASLSTICLFCKNSETLRLGFINNFIRILTIDTTRLRVDCFGCLNFKLVNNIVLGGRNEFTSELS